MKKRKQVSVDELKELLEAKGIQPSYQRLRILKHLSETSDHPSVDLIYKALVKEIPTLSRTTVYNTLNTLVQKKIVEALRISEGELRYDFAESPHSHFICRQCDTVYDIKVLPECLTKDFIEGHKVENAHVYLSGMCKYCLQVKG